MKRLVFLAVLIIIGAVAVFAYTLVPGEPMTVAAVEQEDGSMKLMPMISAAESEPEEENTLSLKDGVEFSLPAGFYSENITVALAAKKGADIYFTTDGSDPVPGKSSLYKEPIEINAGTETRAFTIKATAVSGEKTSGTAVRSYITGQDVDERFDDETLVFVLSTDPYNLYDYEYGIAVKGKIYDDYVREHPGEEIPYNAPANYYMTGREAERPMYVEVFDSDGNNVISQNAGAKVVGGYSRAVDQKSFKLIARKDYDPENGKFKYPFFPDAVTESGAPISEYDRIVLRNGANDREFAGVRDELSQQLARDYGFPATQHTVPAAVFLNGEYYGFSWLHENYNEDYLATQFGGDKERYEIVSNTEFPEEGTERGLSDYRKVTEYYDKDLTDDKVFEKFCALVDVDNMLQYYAMQIFISNKDWPGNNYKAYRYYPEESEKITSEHMDGRWRYLWFDAEYAWGLYGEGYKLRTLSDLLSGKHMSGQSHALTALLKRGDMREKLANTICDLMSVAFSEQNALETLEQLIAKSDNEQFYALGRGITSTWANEGSFADSREQIRDFAKNRARYVMMDMARCLSVGNVTYDVSLTGSVGADAYLNTQRTTTGVVFGSYFTQYGVELKADIYDGFRFVRWEINGKEYTEPALKVTNDMSENGHVYAKLITEKLPMHGENVRIKEICTDKNAGWITLYNPNDDEVSLNGMYLTDDPGNLQRFKLPELIIKPRGELLIVMNNNKTENALMQIQASFSLKKGETLILSDAEENEAAKVDIPLIPEGHVYTQHDSGRYYVK